LVIEIYLKFRFWDLGFALWDLSFEIFRGFHVMEMYRKISKENLKKWLTELKTQAEVLVPAKENGLWTYRNFDGQDIPFNFQNSRLPPKGLFLESLKALFEWKSPDGALQVHPPAASDGQRVVFGW